MVMSKKEREIFEEALFKAELAMAFRWTTGVEPDIPMPKYKDDVTTGWLYSLSAKKVYRAWSTPNSHGNMPFTPRCTQYKNGMALYSTETRALLALRHAVEEQAAANLLEIDKEIHRSV